MIDDNDLGRLIEELTLKKRAERPNTPIFAHFGGPPKCWNWYGPWPVHPSREIKNHKDTIYLNTDNQWHRIYGPAYINTLHDIEAWFRNDKLHRENGPAYRHKNSFAWFYDGELHNLDGPAVIEPAGPKQYWIHGVKFSEKQYKWEIKRRKRKGLI